MNNNSIQKDNLTSHLARAYVEKRTSTKTKREYTVLVLQWMLPNNSTYDQTVFLTDEQIALISSTTPAAPPSL